MTRQAPHPVLARYYRRDDARQSFLVGLFDETAAHYDHLCRAMSLGSGEWYRRNVLKRLGLRPGMTMLDVATGTGLVNHSAVGILGDAHAVVGLDPSAGMLREARRRIHGPLVQGQVEELPFRAGRFDVVTIGYALRHVADLGITFRECLRVLKPGGQILILEISRPRSAALRRSMQVYFTHMLPFVMMLTTRNPRLRVLSRYYWETIATCVAPDVIVDAVRKSGFIDVSRRVFGGVLSEYTALAPSQSATD